MNTIHINLLPKKSRRLASRRILTSIAVMAIVFQSTGGLIPAFAASEPVAPVQSEVQQIQATPTPETVTPTKPEVQQPVVAPTTTATPASNTPLGGGCGKDSSALNVQSEGDTVLCDGTISVQKQLDTDGNGTVDLDGTTSDPRLAGWDFTLSTQFNFQNKTTDNHGTLSFDANVGTYSVREDPSESDMALTAATCTLDHETVGTVDLHLKTVSGLTLEAGKNISCTFTNSAKASRIAGTKFNDLNGDGVRDQGEPGVAGVTIQLDNGSIIVTDVTDVNGDYSFESLPLGSYTVKEDVPDGWVATTTNPVQVTLTCSQTTTVDFGNFQLGKISGYKFDTRQVPLDGWQICLTLVDNDGPVRLSDTNTSHRNCVSTGSGDWPTGYYEFTNLHYGTYRVSEDDARIGAGWEIVSPKSGYYDVTITSGTGVTGEHESYNFINRQLVPDLAVTKTDGLTTANTGQQVAYTIVASNRGETSAENVTVVDTLPAHVAFVSASDSGVYNTTTRTIAWNLGTMENTGPTQSKTLTVTVLLDALFPAGQTVLTNAVAVSTTTTEPNTQNNHAIDTTAVNAAPTIALTKTATPNPVTAGQNINYTMTWSVAGNSLATTVLLSDPIPATTTFVSVADGGSYNATTNTVTWNLGTQTPGATGQVHFIVKTTTPIANGTVITNTASLDAAETDPVLATAPITVSSGPILSITKSSNVTTFTNPGLFVAYTITVTNAATAGDTAKNVVLKDVLPTGFTFDDSSTSKTFTAFDLKPGEAKTFTVNALVGLVTAGTYTNTATAKGDNTTPVSATADVQIRVPEVLGVTSEAQLTLIKEVNTKLTNAGKTIRYAVTVENIGNATAVNVTITDKLPQGFTFVDGGKTTKTFTIGDLPAGQKRSINYEVLVGAKVKQGDYKNIAQAQADNVPAVSADATISVGKPEVLAATGTGPLDYAIAGLGFILAALGIALFITRRPGENQV